MSDLISREAALNSPVTMVSEGLDWIPAYHIKNLPAAQPEKHTKERAKTRACDCISRRKAFEYFVTLWECIGTIMDRDEWEDVCMTTANEIPAAQPERLTDDDFETIRIHLNAYKEKLCNQQRWEEADEYQRIIDRFMAFASAQTENEERKEESAQNVLKDDSVSRKAAIDAVNGVIADYIPTLYGRYEALPLEMAMAIKRLPTAQPEIVRCKDCANWIPGYVADNDDFIPPKCGKYQQMVGHSSDDYCSDAERRTDENNNE